MGISRAPTLKKRKGFTVNSLTKQLETVNMTISPHPLHSPQSPPPVLSLSCTHVETCTLTEKAP